MTAKILCALQLVVLSLILGSFSAHAEESLKTLAHDICHAYLDHPEEFKPIEMTDCEVLYFNGTAIMEDSECFNHSGESYAKFMVSDACASHPIMPVDKSFNAKDMRPINKNKGYNTLGDIDNPFDYKGRLILSSGNDLRLVQGKTQTLLCKFRTKLNSWEPGTGEENPICQKFTARAYSNKVEQVTTTKDLYKKNNGRGWAIQKYRADLDHDGKDETYLQQKIDGSSWRCGIDTNPISLTIDNDIADDRFGDVSRALDIGDDIPVYKKLLAMAISDLTSKGDESTYGPWVVPEWKIVSLDRKDYLLADQEEPKFPELVQKDIARTLYEFRGNRFEKICEQHTNSEKVIQHEAIPRKYWDNLDYKPLE